MSTDEATTTTTTRDAIPGNGILSIKSLKLMSN